MSVWIDFFVDLLVFYSSFSGFVDVMFVACTFPLLYLYIIFHEPI
jgi:hypothetical protein